MQNLTFLRNCDFVMYRMKNKNAQFKNLLLLTNFEKILGMPFAFGSKRTILQLYVLSQAGWLWNAKTKKKKIRKKKKIEPQHDKTNNVACAPREDSDQPGEPPNLIRFIAVGLKSSWGSKLALCGQQRLWSVWADAQTDLSLSWAHMPLHWFCHVGPDWFYN